MHIAIIVVLVIIILSLFALGSRKPDNPNTKSAIPKNNFSFCPLCREELKKGDKLKSKLFTDETGEKKYQRMYIYGCPKCLEDTNSRSRTCPVCGSTLQKESPLLAEFQQGRGDKPHVRVTGCFRCKR